MKIDLKIETDVEISLIYQHGESFHVEYYTDYVEKGVYL